MPPRGRGRAREEEEEEEVGHPPAAGSSSSSGARAGSSSSGRHSNVHSHADQRIMTDSIKTVLDLLGELSKRVKNNKEGVPAEVIQRWKEQIVQLAKEAAKVLKLDERYEDHAARLIQEKFGDLENAESINISELDFDGIQEKIEKLVKADMKSFKPDSNTEVKKIIETCTKKISEEDEDIVMEDTEIRESDLKCPFTLMPMLRPMKK